MHIRVDTIRIKNCSGGPEPEIIEHMPFLRDAIDRSVVKVIEESSAAPDFSNGYTEWRRACGGVYKLTIAEAIAADEYTFNEGFGCKPGSRTVPQLGQ